MKQRIKKLISRARNSRDNPLRGENVKTIAVCAAQVPFFQGGAETHVKTLVDKLRENGFEVELVNIPYKWYPHEQLIKSIKMWQMLDLSESNGKSIDMVISTKFPSYFVEHPRKVVWLIHQYRQMYDLFHTPYSGFDHKNKKDMELREKLVAMDTAALQTYPRIYTNSKNTAARLSQYNGITGIPLYHPPKLVGRYHTESHQDYILSVGRLDKLKRVELLVQAVKYCDARIKCKIVGKGPEMEKLRTLARKNGVEDRVDFLGFVSDDELLRLYAQCALVFFAPQDEDYGYITLEAYLSKKPVITALDSGGPLEFVRHNENGIILKSFEAKDIAAAIESLFFDKSKCESWGKKGFHQVKEIGWESVIQSLVFGDKT